MYFTSFSSDATRYNYGGIGRVDRFWPSRFQSLCARSTRMGFELALTGRRVFPDANRNDHPPPHRLFSMRFRTAWPLKGSIELARL